MMQPGPWNVVRISVVGVAILASGHAGVPGRESPPPRPATPTQDRVPQPGVRPQGAASPASKLPTSADDRGIARSLAVTIRTSKTDYRPVERIVVDYEIRNVDPQGREIHILAHHYWHRRVKAYLRTIDGRIDLGPAPPTNFQNRRLHIPAGGSNGYAGSLKASATESGKLVANLVNDMTAPGEYTIVVEVDLGFDDEAGKWTLAVAHSNAVKVKVSGMPDVSGP